LLHRLIGKWNIWSCLLLLSRACTRLNLTVLKSIA